METTSKKSRTAAMLFALFLGLFGAHRFYVGKTASAIVMLLISITYIGMIVTSIWVLVDFIVIVAGGFKDQYGATLKEW